MIIVILNSFEIHVNVHLPFPSKFELQCFINIYRLIFPKASLLLT